MFFTAAFVGIRKYMGCNHLKSHEYFVESINPQKCSYQTVTCSSYKDFSDGKCFDCGNKHEKCIQFGYHGRKDYEKLINRGIIQPGTNLAQYLRTGDIKPYCRGHYKISVKVSDSKQSKLHGGEIGQFFFIVHSTIDRKGVKSKSTPLNSGGYHEPGKTYTAVVAADEVPNLKGVEVQWVHETSPWNPLTWRFTVSKIYIDSVTIESLEINQRLMVCPKEATALENSQLHFMLPSYCRNKK